MKGRARSEHWSFALLLLLGAVIPARAVAQSAWSLEAEIGGARYAGTTKFADDDRQLLPASHTERGIGIVRRFGQFTLATTASYGAPGLAIDGTAASVIQKGAVALYEFRAIGMHDLFTLHDDIQVAAGGGPALQVWNFIGELSRYRLAVQGRLGVAVPLSRLLTLQLNGELSLTPSSPLEEVDLPDGFERTSMWRRAFFIGMQVGL